MADGINLYCHGAGDVCMAHDGFSDWTSEVPGGGIHSCKGKRKVTAFGYTAACDWLFIASETAECGGTGESYGIYTDYQVWLGMMTGGLWHYGPSNGAYYTCLNLPRTVRNRAYGARLEFVPPES